MHLPTREDLLELAQLCTQTALQWFRKDIKISEKSDQSLVTEADIAMENTLKSWLSLRFPDHGLLAEETAHDPGPAEGIWVADPIDGTTNFSNGNPYFCVSVAFGRRTPHGFQLEASFVAHPPTGDIYTALRGQGSECNGVALRLPAHTPPNRTTVATCLNRRLGADLRHTTDLLCDLQNQIHSLRICGAAALDLALTARGVYQGFFERDLNPWDLAAGALLIQEAGGVVTNAQGGAYDALTDTGVVAGNAGVHAFLWNVLNVRQGLAKPLA